ncbi:trypsin-like peptidase domain-containing protein [Streptomyces sp. NPDC093085]|uniref:trypsin-like peptidase domain-containing protein n=1 Tax=Streptomyces sp. NPDC093085 TaxID=3155068 RepID=UPI0034236DF1
MDDGKPTGPKAKWWSRPAAAVAPPREPAGPSGASGAVGEVTAELPAEPADAVPSPPYSADAVPGVPAPAEPSAEPRAASRVALDKPSPDKPSPGTPSAEPASAGPPAAYAPSADASPAGAPAAEAPSTGVFSAEPSDAPPERPRPLHEPDPYSTPPYGGPGPWAPAPPVQFPTPAGGTALPPYAAAPGAQPPYAQPQHPQQPHQTPQPQRQPQPAQGHPQPSSQWLQYDPWSAPGAGPLTQHGEPPSPGRRRAGTAGLVLVGLMACVIGGGVGAFIERNGGFTRVELSQAGPESTGRAPDSVAGIAASALPSVVTLHVSGGGEQGTGTGFVLDKRGHILTNNHVVQTAASAGSGGEISVTFSGGETARAQLVGKDSGYDLAVVKVSDVSGLKPLPLGNSDNVQVGDPVVAIGAPFDLSNTVTSGIISAKERPITAGGEKGDGSDISYVDALQTDAPINPGNSGGPLVDGRARVIGINSAIRAADSGTGLGSGQAGSIGLGFAIPINQGKRVAEELINTGKATHPVIGVSLDMEFTGDGAKVAEKAAGGGGAVTSGGPGAKAGIRPGDIITAVNGQRVHSGEELIVKIRAHRPGDQLELTLVRDGDERTLRLALGSAEGT